LHSPFIAISVWQDHQALAELAEKAKITFRNREPFGINEVFKGT